MTLQSKMISYKITLSLLTFFIITSSLQAETRQNGNTFVTEVIKPFDMPVDDFKTAALNQLSRNDFRTNEFAGDNITVSKLIYKTTYNGSGRIVDPQTKSSRHSVTEDSIDVIVTYQAVVHPKLVTKKTFNGTTSLKIYLNYTKEINTTGGNTEFQNLNVKVDSSSFKMNYSGTPSSAETKILDNINNGTSSKNKTILSLLQTEEFSSTLVETYFIENIVNQQLSPTYNSSYLYQFGSFNVTFDMTTSSVEAIDGGILNSMKGSIKGFNSIGQIITKSQVNEDVDYHTLFTVDFVKNMVKASVALNNDWKGFKVDRNRFKISAFGWRLIDLEYILDGWKDKYGKYYLNSIRFVCDPKGLDKLGIDQVSDKMHAIMNWTCKCNLLDVNPSPVLLDFDVKLTYIITFKAKGNVIDVMIDKTYADSFLFREVDGMKVGDLKILKHHAKEIVDLIRGYSLGSNFKVKEGSSIVSLKQNEGVWVA